MATTKRKPRTATATASEPAVTPLPAAPQLSIRVDATERARVEACARDAEFHGGATVTPPTVVRKALYLYLEAYERDRQR